MQTVTPGRPVIVVGRGVLSVVCSVLLSWCATLFAVVLQCCFGFVTETDLLEDLKWKSLESRRNESRLTMMYKIVNKQVAIDPDKHLMKSQKQSRSANTNSYVVPYASKVLSGIMGIILFPANIWLHMHPISST